MTSIPPTTSLEERAAEGARRLLNIYQARVTQPVAEALLASHDRMFWACEAIEFEAERAGKNAATALRKARAITRERNQIAYLLTLRDVMGVENLPNLTEQDQASHALSALRGLVKAYRWMAGTEDTADLETLAAW